MNDDIYSVDLGNGAVEIEAEWENSSISTSANACSVKTKAENPITAERPLEVDGNSWSMFSCGLSLYQHTTRTINAMMINYEILFFLSH